MDRKLIEKASDGLHDALEEIMLKGIKTASDIECTKNALSGIKKADELLENDYDKGRSGRVYPHYGYEGNFRSYDNSGRMSRGYDRRYSGHTMKERMMEMMDEATPTERRAIEEALGKMER